jgi:hypothetical protein
MQAHVGREYCGRKVLLIKVSAAEIAHGRGNESNTFAIDQNLGAFPVCSDDYAFFVDRFFRFSWKIFGHFE